ncbi:hypothetical protein MTR67_043730 [Solanum verrucosum]|uniref:Uncharacterized protein n=1 Tax=Solanum verrucosum TaxID=315347 RepID=A0AAF0ZV00_SOLVR|nr:hypothetical protein MTR67_043730 [Solanum verrucosum]
MGEACKWLGELPKDSITSGEELITAFQVRFFPPSKMMTLRDNIQSFKRLEGEPIYMARTNLDMPPHKSARGIVIHEGATASSKNSKTTPPKGGKGKGKEPASEVPEHNSGSEGDSFDSQDSFSEPKDEYPLTYRRDGIYFRVR